MDTVYTGYANAASLTSSLATVTPERFRANRIIPRCNPIGGIMKHRAGGRTSAQLALALAGA